MTLPEHQRLLIVDFGSQVTQLIARRLRESRIYCEIHPYQNVDAAFLRAFRPQAVILSGGPASVTEEGSPRADPEIFALGVPVLGICYGQQAMMAQLGGRVEAGHHAEFGRAFVTPTDTDDPLFTGLFATGREEVWMSHGDRVTALAPGFAVIGTSPNAPFAITTDPSRHFYAVQFHPEVHHTVNGARILNNFTGLAGFTGDWTMAAYKDQAIAAIRARVGREQVICGLSGGVDSSVAAVLIHEAIGDQLTCVFVDTGLMRQGEADEVVRLFRDHYNIPLVHADEGDRFLAALEGVEDPEAKRKTIGRLFIEVFERHAREAGNAAFLAQGTLYPDVIESVSFSGGPCATIKSHHNVGGLPERMNLRLLEPLRELFKDEVRALGRELGLPDALRRPPPVPGPRPRDPLPRRRSPATSSRSSARPTRSISTRSASTASTTRSGRPSRCSCRSARVGVMGDGRTYDYVCALRAVTSVDGMTADYYPFDHGFLSETATRIINEVKGINRVTYDITSKPPGTIEWE